MITDIVIDVETKTVTVWKWGDNGPCTQFTYEGLRTITLKDSERRWHITEANED